MRNDDRPAPSTVETQVVPRIPAARPQSLIETQTGPDPALLRPTLDSGELRRAHGPDSGALTRESVARPLTEQLPREGGARGGAMARGAVDGDAMDRAVVLASVQAGLFGVEAEPVRIGRFVVLERLGAGGMGVVYRAYDPKLDRRVALKVLHGWDEPGTRGSEKLLGEQARLEKEARAAAQLSHPNVIGVFDVGVHDERVYLALEYVEGRTLGGWQRHVEPDWASVVRMYVQAGRGLVAAHEAGIVHRDFKPDNVLVGEDGRARVLDFGLARSSRAGGPRALESAEVRNALRTAELGESCQSAAVAGTPAYMAPEQFLGVDVGPHSDQFGFCVALYEALFGDRPFEGDSALELALAVCDEAERPREPPRDTPVPRRITDALQKGLAHEPDQRWSSLAALLDELEDALDAPARRRRWAVLGLAGAILVGGSYGIASANQPTVVHVADPCAGIDDQLSSTWGEAQRAALKKAFAGAGLDYADTAADTAIARLDRFASSWTDMRREVCEAHHVDGTEDEVVNRVRVACLDRRQASMASTIEVLTTDADPTTVDQAGAVLDELGGVDACADTDRLVATYEEVGRLRHGGGEADGERVRKVLDRALLDLDRVRIAAALGRHDEALALLERIDTSLAGVDLPSTRAKVAMARGELQALAYDEAAVETLEGALELALAADDPYTAQEAGEALFGAYVDVSGDLERARLVARTVVGLSKRPRATPELRASAAHVQGRLAMSEGRLAEASEHLAAACEGLAGALGPDSTYTLTCRMDQGGVFQERGLLDEGRTLLEDTSRRLATTHGEHHPMRGIAEFNLGTLLSSAGEAKAAGESYDLAETIFRAAYGDAYPQAPFLEWGRAELARRAGEPSDAVERMQTSVELGVAAFGEAHPQVADLRIALAGYLLDAARALEAREVLDMAWPVLEGTYGDDGVGMAEATLQRARMQLAVGATRKAQDTAERAATLAEERGDAALGGRIALCRAQIALTQGDRSAARAFSNTAIDALAPTGAQGALELAQARALLAD